MPMDRTAFLATAGLFSLLFLTNPMPVLRAWRQPVTELTLDRAKFTWDWRQDNGSMVDEFEIVCGSVRKSIADPSARSILVKDVVPGTGTYRTVTVVARNRNGSTEARTTFPPIRVNRASELVTVLD